MAFRGDVGQISLLNIYQALNLNQQGGVLVVTSGKLRRRIRFVSEGIRLLANGPGDPEPLNQILSKLKILTESQLNNVIGTKNNDGVPLGDFLIQRRLVDPSFVSTEISKHSLELIYETFSWEPAKYEFNAGEEGDEYELFDPDTYGRYMTYRIESVLMEVARREDEWKRIQSHVTSSKVIFIPTDPVAFAKEKSYKSELGDEEFNEIKALIDGQRSIDTICHDTTLSKYETYRVLSELIQLNEIRPLSAEEKKAIAEKLRKKFKLREVIDIYGQLLQDDPGDIETRLNLVSILEKKKEYESQLVEHYQYIANHALEHGELNNAKAYLDQIIAIEPYNVEAHDKLFDVFMRTQKPREGLAQARTLVEAVKVQKAYALGATLLEKLIHKFPEEHSFYHECADFHQFDGNPEDAVRNLKRVAALYEKRDDFTRLRKTWERIATIDPGEGQNLRRYQDLERQTAKSLWKRLYPSLVVSSIMAVILLAAYWGVMEFFCRQAYASIRAEVDTLVDNGQYDEAVGVLNSLERIYPLSSVRWNIAKKLRTISESKRKTVQQERMAQEEKNTQFTSYLAQVTTLIRNNRFVEAWSELQKYDREGLNESNLSKLREIEKDLRTVFAKSDALLKKAEALTRSGKHQEAHAYYIRLLMEYPHTPSTRGLEIPLVVRTVPPGAEVIFNDRPLGRSPLLLRYNPFARFHLRLRKHGFEEYLCGEGERVPACVEFTRDWYLTVPLKRVPAWVYGSADITASVPAVDSSHVYVPTRTGTIVCLDRKTGTVRWTSRSSAIWGIRDAVKTWKSAVYFGTTDGRFRALETETGKTRFDIQPAIGERSTRVFSSEPTPGGGVCVISGSTVTGVKLADGSRIWTKRLQGVLETAPRHYRNNFVVCTSRGEIHLLDMLTGGRKKSFDMNRPLSKVGSVSGSALFLTDDHGVIYKINLGTGRTEWSYRCARTDLGPPEAADGNVIVASRSGYLLALDAERGSRRWDFTVDDGFPAPATYLNGELIIGSASGLLLSLDPATGNFFWTFKADGSLSERPVSSASYIVVVSARGTLYAFSID